MKIARMLLLIGAGLVISLMAARANTTLTTLALFTRTNGMFPGAIPEAALVQGSDGNFYGTTIEGGTNGPSGYGTIFKITTNGICTNLFSFNNTNGSFPQAGLMQANDGNFYGTTTGGTNSIGTIFRMTPAGSVTQLFAFSGANGYDPNGLIQGADGLLYGTTYYGGTNPNGSYGTVFAITTNGALASLASFGNTNGAEPQAGLVQTRDGNLYGTTVNGGTNGGWGTVFKVTTNGQLTSLFSFNGTNGANPLSALTLGPDGLLYGTTEAGGTNFSGSPFTGNGTVFKITTNGQLTTIHFFTGYPVDGAAPYFNDLVPGSDGYFYGTTYAGGTNGGGTVFRFNPNGNYAIPYCFSNLPAGYSPQAGLIQGHDGNFYGTTSSGGISFYGTVFKLSVPLSSPADQISAVKVAGTNVLVTVPSVWPEIYQLQSRASLTAGTWANVNDAAMTGIGGALTLTNMGGGTSAQRFYRLGIMP